jgi:hypothetical protein
VKILLAIVLAAAGATFALLPPRAVRLDQQPGAAAPVLRGVLHVHTNRSDGTGTPDAVAAAAARAGLSFVIFTDHGDAAVEPSAPTYRSGVLCIDAVEISTDGGHVLALGLPRVPYPLGGTARDVLEDVARFGGMAIVAHPTSTRASLRWTGGDERFDGIEWLNGDSEWRNESIASLARIFWTYWIRPAESLAQLLDRPGDALALWDRLAVERAIVGVAGSDAHARLGLRGVGEPYDGRPVARLPGYEPTFRAFSIAVPGLLLTENAAADAAATVDAIRAGRVVSVVDALAGPAWLDFSGSNSSGSVEQGGVLEPGGPVTLRAEAPAVPGSRMRLLRDGREVSAGSAGGSLVIEQPADPATYRVEVTLPSSPGQPPAPWLISNPVYVGRRKPAPWSEPPPPEWPARSAALYTDEDAALWAIEHSIRADGRVSAVAAASGRQLNLKFALAGSRADNPFVALVRPLHGSAAGADSLLFEARSSRPMRISVQFRAPQDSGGRRWTRSVYLDEGMRRVELPLREFLPAGHDGALGPEVMDTVLFVVDGLNTALGQSGQVWLDSVALGAAAAGNAGAPQVRTDSSR